MSEPRRLARYLADCRARACAPDVARSDVKLWMLALDDLVKRHLFDTAAYAAAALGEAFPQTAYFHRMAAIFERLPPAVDDPPFASFVGRPDRDVEIVPRAGATVVLLSFGGRFGGMGIPRPLLHRWFGRTGVHVVYLRDPRETAYNAGIPSLATDYAGSVRALRRIADDLAAARIVCYGTSSGSYGALRYGLDLPASSCLGFGPVTSMSRESMGARVGERLRFSPGPDLRALYEAAGRRPRVRLVYGADHPLDAANATNMAGIEGVALEAIPGWAGHDPILHVIAQDRLPGLLADLVGAEPARSGHEAR